MTIHYLIICGCKGTKIYSIQGGKISRFQLFSLKMADFFIRIASFVSFRITMSRGLVPVIIVPFPLLYLALGVLGVLCQTLLKHYQTSTCEIFYIELTLQGCEVRRGVHQGSKVKCLNTG